MCLNWTPRTWMLPAQMAEASSWAPTGNRPHLVTEIGFNGYSLNYWLHSSRNQSLNSPKMWLACCSCCCGVCPIPARALCEVRCVLCGRLKAIKGFAAAACAASSV